MQTRLKRNTATVTPKEQLQRDTRQYQKLFLSQWTVGLANLALSGWKADAVKNLLFVCQEPSVYPNDVRKRRQALDFPKECHRPKVSQCTFTQRCLMSALCGMSFYVFAWPWSYAFIDVWLRDSLNCWHFIQVENWVWQEGCYGFFGVYPWLLSSW